MGSWIFLSRLMLMVLVWFFLVRKILMKYVSIVSLRRECGGCRVGIVVGLNGILGGSLLGM